MFNGLVVQLSDYNFRKRLIAYYLINIVGVGKTNDFTAEVYV